MTLTLVACLCVCVCASVSSERILAVFPLRATSHFGVYKPVLEELSHRGHHVTVISPFPRSPSTPTYTDIDVQNITDHRSVINLNDNENLLVMFEKVVNSSKVMLSQFERVFQDERVLSLLDGNKFDAVLTELFMSDMFVGLSHKFRAPLITMTSAVILPWGTDRLAVPDNPSYIASTFSTVHKEMGFFGRLGNTFSMLLSKFIYMYFSTANDERINKEYLGADMPKVEDIVRRTSLLLVNTHVSINGARPLPPNVVEIGGVHLKPTAQIPKDLERFINESEHGVVYFSLGSVVNGSSITDSMLSAFCQSFSKIKQRVLWKWDLDFMPGKPDNVKIVKWMPQADILANPKTRAFISHGGLLGTIEAVHHGVPVIGIPVFADQFLNIGNLVKEGAAKILHIPDISEESVTSALRDVLEDPKYKMNMQRLSRTFRDRPMSPIDTAIYWIEYVLRHKGAHHLRTAAVDLPWYQYILLDVFAFSLAVSVIFSTLIIYAIKLISRSIFGKKKVKIN